MEDLPGGRHERDPALDPKQAGVAPGEPHDLLGSSARADRREERLGHDLGGERAHGRVDEEPEARPSLRILLLDQLVVYRATTEAPGQHLLQHPDHVGVEEGHARERVAAPGHERGRLSRSRR
jgi:hypothetical protein